MSARREGWVIRRSGALAAGLVWVALMPGGLAGQDRVGLPGADTPSAVSLEAVFTVGVVEGADWEAFASVNAVAFSSGGDLFVLDGMNQRVIVWNREGRHLRTFGRKGGGPGEFQEPQGMTVLDDGTVVVYDGARRAYSVLRSDGSLVRSVGTDIMADAAIPVGRLRAGPEGFLAEYRGMDIDTGDPATSSEGGGALLVKLFSTAGGGGVNVVTARNPGGRARMVSRPGEVSVRLNPGPAFTPVFDWGVLRNGGVAYIDSDAYEVSVVSGASAVRRVLTRPFEPFATTERDRRDERARRLQAMEERGEGVPRFVEVENGVRRTRSDLEAGRRMLERLEFANTRPVVAGLAVDRDGRIWVQRTGRRVGTPGPVDILSAEGRYLGSTTELTRLPDAFGPGGLAAFVRTDDLGVQSVEVMRVRVGT